MYKKEFTVQVAARFPPALVAKLDQLAAASYRTPSDVLRLLVQEARVMPKRDIRMRAPVEPLAPEMADVSA
jgi:hypothetical protein